MCLWIAACFRSTTYRPGDLMKILTSRQKDVLNYLKGKDWTSPTDIGGAVWGEGHHSSSASPVCKRLVGVGALERNEKGHYRIPKGHI